MTTLWVVLLGLLLLSVAIWGIELLPLQPQVKRIGEAVLVLAFVASMLHRFRLFGL